MLGFLRIFTSSHSSSSSSSAGSRFLFRCTKPPIASNSSSSVGSRFLISSSSSSSQEKPRSKGPPVAIFWDLDNKPPNAVPPYDAAVRLKLAASQFGPVRYTVAYANHHAFRHVPASVRDQRRERKALDRLEDSGVLVPAEPHLCRVCGRRFYNHTKLINHFKQIHEREHSKRLGQLDSAKGSRRVKLAAKLSMKMDKYRRAAREVLVPKVGYGLGDELRRAGIWVRTVPDRPEAADRALREHMTEAMDEGAIGCLVLVSDDSGFTGVLKEARMRCLKTVVVGDDGDGVLKRCADTGFSWREVASGKARKEAASVVGRWKDRELLKRLEWTYRPGEGEERGDPEWDNSGGFEGEIEDDGDVSGFNDEAECEGLVGKRSTGPWWELEPADSTDLHVESST